MTGDAAGLRIAIVCPYSMTWPGGVQAQAAGLAAWLRERVREVTLYAPSDGAVDIDGFVSLGRSTAFRDNGATTRVAMSPRGWAQVRQAVRNADVIHVHEPMHLACLAALTETSAPVIGTFHMSADGQRWYRIFGPVLRRAARRLDRRVAVSPSAAAFARAALPGRYTIVPNAIDASSFARRRDGAPPPGRRILFVGRPDPRKGLSVLLGAHARLTAPAELHLAGVSDQDLAASGWVRLPGIHAHGRVSPAELRALLRRADLLCTPSLASESFGLTIVEGMAAGLPVVASDLPAYRDLLAPACGVLVPPGDTDRLTAALDDVLASPASGRAMGREGRKAAARYDWSAVGPRTLQIYEDAVSARRAA